jgi:hypothetical protein
MSIIIDIQKERACPMPPQPLEEMLLAVADYK